MTDPADDSFLPRTLQLSSFEEQDASALAAINSRQPLNPAQAYLIGLSSSASRKTMGSFLNIVAGMLGFSSLQSCAWGSLRRHRVRGLLEMLAASGRAPATINTYLSALKGTAREAWMMKQTDTESYQQIQAVRAVRGSRLARGRALAAEEIHALFRCCDDDSACRGPRDAAMLAVMLGCGLRRSEVVDLDYCLSSRRCWYPVRETKSGWPLCRRRSGSASIPGRRQSATSRTGRCLPAYAPVTASLMSA